MIRPFGPLIAIFALAGCQQPGPAVDPFLYRSTIPPPGTSTSAAPTVMPGPQPYYNVPPATSVSPAPDAAAPLVQPAPVVPAPAPVVPALPPRNFPQRGGFDFPQSWNGPPPKNGWDGDAIGPTAGSTSSVAAAPPPPEVVRIIEPPAEHVTALPDDGSAQAIFTSGTPTNPAPAESGSIIASGGALPPGALPASAAMPIPLTAGSAGTSVNFTGDHPGVSYGYDPGYGVLRGKLDYSVTARLWRLRYLPPEGPTDEFGGNVVIADSRQVNGFEPGDFVTVRGTFSPPSSSGSSATFVVRRIKRQ